MKRIILLLSVLYGLLLGSCVKDPGLDPASCSEGEIWTSLEFGHKEFEQIQVTTRSTLGPITESRISNLYVFLFDSEGNRVYGHFFDSRNLRDSEAEVSAANVNCWIVNNRLDESSQTTGTIRMKIPQLTGGTFCIVANLDPDMSNVSSEKFSFIRTYEELYNLTTHLNQEITSRNGMFLMSGYARNITVSQQGITTETGGRLRVELTRLDAKIKVKVRAAIENESLVETQGTQTLQRIKSFTPESWRVVNLPKGSYLIEHPVSEETRDAAEGFFNSAPINFEDKNNETFTYIKSDGTPKSITAPVYEFSFYMYENRPEAKQTVSQYHQRDLRIKDAAGAYDTSEGLWVHAPEAGTYLIVTGEISMDVDVGAESKNQTLNASVVYYIHLGDFGQDPNDFRIKRNTQYTYTITIKGVKSIQVEVDTNVEQESGSTGHVYIAKESIHTFDAHYGQRVFAFDEESITPNDVTWYVKTPFGREGMPEVINGADIPNGLDYKWVSFMINNTEASGGYSHNNRKYNPEQVMDVIEFCAYIKAQKIRFDNNQQNDFRMEEDPELKQLYPDNPEIYRRYRIYATIFVDEFYYDKDPISGEVRPTLWKEFVNQPNRTMHILCDTKFSKDGESSSTGSVVTIRQNSIQTIYDTTNESLQSGWGTESIDETEGRLWFYNRTETHGNTAYNTTNYGNDSRSNGLYNTARLWNMTDGTGGFTYKYWNEFLDVDRENDHEYLFLKDRDDVATARYTCMMRNRDNNGNGIIDASEIRWYLASIQQLTALYMGDQGISNDAQLYDRYNDYTADETDAFGGYLWRRHIISSTRWGGSSESNYPTMLWAEEGLSTSAYQQYSEKAGRYAVRCVRNLGMDPTDETTAIANLNNENNLPNYSITFQIVNESYSTNSIYRFDVSHINKKSTRYYTSRELEPGNEHSESARLYTTFETGPLLDFTGNYSSLKAMIERGESPCPEGYRVPNIREANLMSNYITSDINPSWWNDKYIYVNSYYSFGTLGKNFDNEISWYCTDKHVTISPPENIKIRCVRDIH